MSYYLDNEPILAWHGTKADGTTQHLKVKETVGVKNVLADDIVLCENAFHGSIRVIDMSLYSDGLRFKRTLHEGIILHDNNKIGSSERTVIAEADATQVVLKWAFWCANRAIQVHAVTTLRRAGMDAKAEKLTSLEEITNKESAGTAAIAIDVRTAMIDAAYAANTAACAANAAADTIYSIANYTSRAAANASITVDSAYFTEMNFLNAELEQRLFILMGITEKEGLA